MRVLMLALTGLFLAGCVADGRVHHGHWHGPVHAVPVYRPPPPVYVAPAWRPPRTVYVAPARRPPVYHAPRPHWHGHHHRGWHGPRHSHRPPPRHSPRHHHSHRRH